MLKISVLFKKIQTLCVNNSRILMSKNAKFSGYYFYMNMNIWGDFQICISVPLMNVSFAQPTSKIANLDKLQQQPSRGILRKRCSENTQQIYKRTSIPNCEYSFGMGVLL